MVLDPEGNVTATVGNPHEGSMFYQDAAQTPVPFAELKRAVDPQLKGGLLGGLAVPAAAKPLAKALKLGQLATVQASLASIPDGSPDLGAFKAELTKRLDALRARKLELFSALEKDGKKWEAGKVGESLLRCFPNAKEAGEVRGRVDKLKQEDVVRKNTEARGYFLKILELGYGFASNATQRAGVKASCAELVRRYPNTEAAGLVGSLNDSK